MSETPDTGALSLDAATALLDARDETPEVVEQEETAPAEGEIESEGEPTPEDADAPEEASEGEGEEPQDETEAQPPIAAPQSWDAEARAVWGRLDREAQEVILARETARDAATSKALQESAEARKRADETVQGVTQLQAATAQILQQAGLNFQGKWDSVDWDAWFQTDPQAALIAERQMQRERGELERLAAVNQQQQAVAFQEFQRQKAEKIKTEAPDLVDPVHGAQRVGQLESFLEANGIPRNIFHTLDAFTIGLAYDGMRYRDAQRAVKTPAKQPTRTAPAVRPSAGQQVRAPQRAIQEASAKLSKTGKFDDALALLNARSR